jgi:hypothetical protein
LALVLFRIPEVVWFVVVFLVAKLVLPGVASSE